jgi:hypothetical protein
LPFRPPQVNRAALPPVREALHQEAVLQHPDRVVHVAVVEAVDEAADSRQLLQVPHRDFPMGSRT